MAKTNYRGHLQADMVPLKKYFYVMRALLAARWLLRNGSAAPIEFEKLLVHLDNEPAVRAEVDRLLVLKRASPELGKAPAIALLNAFIEAELENEPIVAAKQTIPTRRIDFLNQLFHQILAADAPSTAS